MNRDDMSHGTRLRYRFATTAFAVFGATWLVTGCVYITQPRPTAPPVPITLHADGDSFVSAAEPSGQLWRGFNDQTLDLLIDTALKNNRSLAQIVGRLDETRALRGIALNGFFPSVSATARRNTQVSSTLNPFVPPSIGKTTTFASGFSSSWEFDLFGATLNGVRAANADVSSVEFDLLAARQAVVAEVAQAYFALRADQQHQLYSIERVELLEKQLQLAVERRNVGRTNGQDLEQAKSDLAIAAAAAASLDGLVAQDFNRIATLTVMAADSVHSQLDALGSLPQVPKLVPVGMPTAWFGRRPDVHSAEMQFLAAYASVNSARADYFPHIDLNGSFGWNAQRSTDLGRSAAREWTFGPSLSWRFLDITRIRQQVKAADARSRIALARFDETILRALEETNDCFSAYRSAHEARADWDTAQSAALTQWQLARERLSVGSIDQSVLIAARLNFLNTAYQSVAAHTREVSALAALYKALAGDFARKE